MEISVENILQYKERVQCFREQNRRKNFPTFQESMTLKPTSDVMGPKFGQIMSDLQEMESTFGLCGILALHACAITTKSTAEYGKGISYSPTAYKEQFERSLVQDTPRAYDVFVDKFFPHMTIEEKAITDPDQLRQLLSSLGDNQGLSVCVMCHYPEENGDHTHYLAAQADGEHVRLIGDLSPFGLQCVGITVPVNELVNSMEKVVGATLTTNVAERLLELNQRFGDGQEQKSPQSNAAIQTFN